MRIERIMETYRELISYVTGGVSGKVKLVRYIKSIVVLQRGRRGMDFLLHDISDLYLKSWTAIHYCHQSKVIEHVPVLIRKASIEFCQTNQDYIGENRWDQKCLLSQKLPQSKCLVNPSPSVLWLWKVRDFMESPRSWIKPTLVKDRGPFPLIVHFSYF